MDAGDRTQDARITPSPVPVSARNGTGPDDAGDRLATLLAVAEDAIITVDAEGRIRGFNAAAERMFGHTAGDVLGRDMQLLIPPGMRPGEHGGYVQRYLRTGEARIIGTGRDVEGLRADGSTFPLHLTVGELRADGEPQFIGIAHDLSALRSAERRHRSIVETAADAILLVDGDGRVIEANPAAARQFAIPPARFPGRRLRDLLADPAVDALPAPGGHAGPGRRMPARRADGSIFPMRLSVGAMEGDPPAYTVIVHDESSAVAAEDALRRAADEREALRRLTMAVAVEAPMAEVCATAAHVMAQVLDAGLGLVARFADGEAHLVGLWPAPAPDAPLRRPLVGDGALARVYADDAPAIVRDYAALAAAGDPAGIAGMIDGCASGAAHPIHVAGRLWGAVLVAVRTGESLAEDVQERLAGVGELVALAVANAEARERLASQAEHDPLTGLANHRVFHERLDVEVVRARREGAPLSLMLIDVDHLGRVNDELGHQAGDALIAALGRRLASATGPGELMARIGGDEFACILPGTGGPDAVERADAARRAVAAIDAGGSAVTLSVGICALDRAADATELFRLADGALFWAKHRGRDGVCLYSPDVVRELSHAQRAEQLARHQALVGIRALARAVDAKDPLTRRHSERVAACADRIAAARGWDEGRRALLREAALLHDVGKIGIPDAVLFKPGRLDDQEFALIRTHPQLGADIADEVLGAEQVRWIREHHERIDGRGYPLGLTGDRISEGGRILALSDAWDVMTSLRSYKEALDIDAALAEVRRCAGTQFDPELARLLVDIEGGAAAHDEAAAASD